MVLYHLVSQSKKHRLWNNKPIKITSKRALDLNTLPHKSYPEKKKCVPEIHEPLISINPISLYNIQPLETMMDVGNCPRANGLWTAVLQKRQDNLWPPGQGWMPLCLRTQNDSK